MSSSAILKTLPVSATYPTAGFHSRPQAIMGSDFEQPAKSPPKAKVASITTFCFLFILSLSFLPNSTFQNSKKLSVKYKHHLKMGCLRIKSEAFGVRKGKTGLGELGEIASKRHRVARNVNQAVDRAIHDGSQSFFGEPRSRRVYDEGCGDIDDVFDKPIFGRGRDVFYSTRCRAIFRVTRSRAVSRCRRIFGERRRNRQINFSVFEATFFAFDSRNLLELVLQNAGKEADSAEQVDQPSVRGLAA